MMGLLAKALPRRRPEGRMSYAAALISTLALLRSSRLLRRRAVYQGLLFGAFNVFWTASPLMLRDRFGLTQRGIALFALAAAGGALSAPAAGRLADRGWTKPGAALAMSLSALSFLVAGWSADAARLLPLVAAAVVLDAATQANHILSQRVIYGLAPEARGRINAAYMTAIFLFGAAGSVVGGLVYADGGWPLTVWVGTGLGLAALLFFATE
jgi:predicted MFS family arabinose efflux permease